MYNIHQIYIAAFLTTAFAFLVIGGFLKWKTPKEELPLLISLMLIELPMAITAFYLVRMPLLDGLVQLLINKDTGLYRFITIFYAPLTEEPAKLLPLIIPFFYRRVNETNCIRAAMALGLGFGLGEIWLVATFIASTPAYANIPWYQFTGFANERFMVCLIHGAFTATALRMKYVNKKFVLGIACAMGLHYLGNFPIYLSHLNFGNFGQITWGIILSVYTMVFFILMLLLLAYYSTGKMSVGSFLFGKSVCPGCNTTYSPPLLGLNWFNKRYEKCPNCRKWHWVTKWKSQ